MSNKNAFINRENIMSKLPELSQKEKDEFVIKLEKIIEKELATKKRLIKKIAKSHENYERAERLLDIYPDLQNNIKLPSWIIANIEDAKVTGNNKQTIILQDGRTYQINNRLNHLSGQEWTYFTNSVINTAYKTSGKDSMAHNIRKIHPTPKPPQLMGDIIKFFTKEGELVFDYFMGVGGSLLGAGITGRKAIGVDLSQRYISAYKMAAEFLGLPTFTTVCDDCIHVLCDKEKMREILADELISLVLIDPPYGNMMSRKKTGADKKIYGEIATPFTNNELDLGNLELKEYFVKLKESIELIIPYMKTKGYIVIFIKDLQPNGKETNLLHSDLIKVINSIDCINYKGLKIWADQSSKLYPYGYPFSFVANQIHQYILVFRKEK